jgi:hypothetical protein
LVDVKANYEHGTTLYAPIKDKNMKVHERRIIKEGDS